MASTCKEIETCDREKKATILMLPGFLIPDEENMFPPSSPTHSVPSTKTNRKSIDKPVTDVRHGRRRGVSERKKPRKFGTFYTRRDSELLDYICSNSDEDFEFLDYMCSTSVTDPCDEDEEEIYGYDD